MANEKLSLDKTEKMYGVEIKKMPCGKYFEALQTLKDLPESFIKEAFDGKEVKLSSMLTTDNLISLITKLLMILPDFTFNFLSKILDIDSDVIRNKLTPFQLIKIIKKFIEINELEDFLAEMKPIVTKTKQKMQSIGFNEQSQSALKSVLAKKNS